MSDSEFLPMKVLPETHRKRLPLLDEIRLARKSPAYIWFQCLELSEEYKQCCEQGGKGELADTYNKFGNIFEYSNFDIWWRKHGRFLFVEEKPFNKAKLISTEDMLSQLRLDSKRLIIEIPLTIRKQTAMRQVGKFLKLAYQGLDIDIYKESTAKVKFEKSKMRITTAELLLKIHKLRVKYPKYSLAKIGDLANVQLDVLARAKTDEALAKMNDQDFLDRRMTIAVSRYTAQANKLIYDAVRGKFPMLKTNNESR
jgi:hypothetical protein